MSQQVVLSVSQVNSYIRDKLDADPMLSYIAVRGEISNYKVYPSGHHYFTIKDEAATLKCVMFKGNAIRLRFRPDNGMTVIAIGKISVYPRDGAYQLYCTSMAMDGVGDLYAAFEALKTKLSAQGLFNPEHKQPLPKYPATIGIITSSAGAAIHDMLRILAKRFPLTKVKLLPVRVQGAEAPAEIASAIEYANYYRLADLLIVGRGGGSIEDLWAFNDELVARAIYSSAIPVISAVGHEPDVTISDFVADVRAATPSNAAELAVPDQDSLRQQLDSMLTMMSTAMLRRLSTSRKHLEMLSGNTALQSPEKYVTQRRNDLKLIASRMQTVQQTTVSRKKQHFIALTAKLDAMSPLKVLTRGYAMVRKKDGQIVRSITDVSKGTGVSIILGNGIVDAEVLSTKETTI